MYENSAKLAKWRAEWAEPDALGLVSTGLFPGSPKAATVGAAPQVVFRALSAQFLLFQAESDYCVLLGSTIPS